MKRILFAIVFICIAHQLSQAQTPQTDTTSGPGIRIDSSVVSDRLPIFRKPNRYLYTPERAAAIVSVIGEPDVLRQITTLPGVSSGVEGSLGLFVRGGNAGNSRVEYDGVPIYGTSHLLGLFSSFSPDMISVTDFRTGGIEASSGDITSSLMRIKSKSGKLESPSWNLSLSPYMTSIYHETPGKKGKTDYRVAGRFSPLPLIAGIITGSDEEYAKINGLMHDWAATVERRLNDKNAIKLTGLFSQDRLNVKYDASGALMQNISGMAKLDFRSSLSSRTEFEVFGYCTFSNVFQNQDYYRNNTTSSSYSMSCNWIETGMKSLVNHKVSCHLDVEGGMEVKTFMKALSGAVFADINFRNSKCDVMAGYRQILYHYEGWTTTGFDAHLRVDRTLTKNLGIEVAADRMSQYMHVLEGLPTGWAMNIMSPAGKDFKPEISGQIYAGLLWHKDARLKLLGETAFHLNAGGYAREMNGMISYKSSINMFRITEDTWEDEIESGSGRSIGLEVSGSMSSERLSMNIAYTLSRTDREYPSINEGERFPFKFDRPHILNLQSDLTTRKRARGEQHLGIVLSCYSGNLMTVQKSQYLGVKPPYWDTGLSGMYTDKFQDNIYYRMEMSAVNGHRMKAYFRLDVAYTFKFLLERSTHDLTVSVFNVTNRHNPYLIYNDYGTWKQVSIMPVMPSVRWSVRF